MCSGMVHGDSAEMRSVGEYPRTLYYISPQDPESAYSVPYAVTHQPRKMVLVEESAYQYARQYCPEKKRKSSTYSGCGPLDNPETSRHCSCLGCIRSGDGRQEEKPVAVTVSSGDIYSTPGTSHDPSVPPNAMDRLMNCLCVYSRVPTERSLLRQHSLSTTTQYSD